MKTVPPSNVYARIACLALLTAALTACSVRPEFMHDIPAGPRPWNGESFDAGPGKFTFAVFSDLTGGERERVFEIAVAQLALLRPELIINVGDLIEGGTDDHGELSAQWDSFDQRARRARAPVFYVGGNHDLTGSMLKRVWDERYGRRYYHFVYRDVLFLVLDTEDTPPARAREIFEARNHAIRVMEEQGYEASLQTDYGRMPERLAGDISRQQADYFLDILREHDDVRWTFLFLHKSPWLRDDLAAFAAIEDALAERPYTVFSGHFHAYEHLERRGRDYIRLATTGGVQPPGVERSMDHVTLVTVDDVGADIVNLRLDGILDKSGRIPLDGDDVCFEAARC